jgi:hypothetical protein
MSLAMASDFFDHGLAICPGFININEETEYIHTVEVALIVRCDMVLTRHKYEQV